MLNVVTPLRLEKRRLDPARVHVASVVEDILKRRPAYWMREGEVSRPLNIIVQISYFDLRMIITLLPRVYIGVSQKPRGHPAGQSAACRPPVRRRQQRRCTCDTRYSI